MGLLNWRSNAISPYVLIGVEMRAIFFFNRGMDSQFSGGPLPPDKHAKDIPFLDKYALERWEVGHLPFLLFKQIRG